MNRKFFSLFKGETLKASPQSKVIPAEEFSTLLGASELLERVKKDAEEYKATQIHDEEKVKAIAAAEGFEEGFRCWSEAVAALEKEIKNVRAEVEKVIASVALKAARKIVGREIELSDNTIVDIVSASLKSVSQHKKITIYVNKKDLAALEANRGRLKDLFESLESLSLRERQDIQPGGCVIETEGGIINAQLENQWRTLERAFEALLKPKTEVHD